MLTDVDKNPLRSSQRRDVFIIADPAHEMLELVKTGRGKERVISRAPQSLASEATDSANSHYRTVRIRYVLLKSLAIAGASFLGANGKLLRYWLDGAPAYCF